MTILEHEPSPEEADAQFRNTTRIDELGDFLRRVGHPEVEQHRPTERRLGRHAIHDMRNEEFTD